MFNKTLKLLSLFFLLLVSFIYTNKVYEEAKKTDPIMKKITKYKKNNDILPVEAKVKNNVLTIGLNGSIINQNASYKIMKQNDTFDIKNVVYDIKKPNITVDNSYSYYIENGNNYKKNVSIIFKVTNGNLNSFIKLANKNKINITFFVDGFWLSKHIEEGFLITNSMFEMYNLGYENKYDKNYINMTNNLIESITLKSSKFCLNENKVSEYLNICKNKKMLSISPKLVNPSFMDIKKNLKPGLIIAYDFDTFNLNDLTIINKIIISRGYNILSLSKIINEDR